MSEAKHKEVAAGAASATRTGSTVQHNNRLQLADKAIIRRAPQWQYIVPVAAAPVAHWFVSAIRGAPPARQRMLKVAVVCATFGAVGTRLWLMGDAGYPGAEGIKPGRDRLSDD